MRLWALILAGPPITAFAAWMVTIIWKGPWPVALAGQQLMILGWSLWILLGLLAGLDTPTRGRLWLEAGCRSERSNRKTFAWASATAVARLSGSV